MALSFREEVKQLKERYKKGMKVRLVKMGNDPRPVPPNTIGTITHVDDMGQIHVNWETGSTLALLPSEDTFFVV